jgi:hypothetical protein
MVAVAVQLSGNRNVPMMGDKINVNANTMAAISTAPKHNMLEFSPALTLSGPGQLLNGKVTTLRFGKDGAFMDSNARASLTSNESAASTVRQKVADELRANKQLQNIMRNAPSILESINKALGGICNKLP